MERKQTEKNMTDDEKRTEIKRTIELLQEFWNSYRLLMNGDGESYIEFEQANKYLKGIWKVSPEEFEYRIAQAKKCAMRAIEILKKKETEE